MVARGKSLKQPKPVPVIPQRMYRKVIRIRAEDSPNVRYGLAELKAGQIPSDRMLIHGVLSYSEYAKRRQTFDKVKQCISLDAMFWEGAEKLLFPPIHLNLAEHLFDFLRGKKRTAKGIGVDPAEGGDMTAMCAVDEHGVIEAVGRKTPNTAEIRGEVLAFAKKHGCPEEAVVFDNGGGGRQIVQNMNDNGFSVRGITFGEAVTPEVRIGSPPIDQRVDERAERSSYPNRRTQMYFRAGELLEPFLNKAGVLESQFAIPPECTTLRQELAPIPKGYDDKGRPRLPPKRKGAVRKRIWNGHAFVEEKSLEELIGHSPDYADAMVLAIHAMEVEGAGMVEVGSF